jgi:hypothetical protein
VPLADLEAEWRQFLDKQPLTTRERAQASEEFRRPAIFKRVRARAGGAAVEARGISIAIPRAPSRSWRRPAATIPPSRTTGWRSRGAGAGGQRERALVMLGQLGGRRPTSPCRCARRRPSLAAEINFAARDYVRAENESKRAAELASSEIERRQALARAARAGKARWRDRRWVARCSATSAGRPKPIRC